MMILVHPRTKRMGETNSVPPTFFGGTIHQRSNLLKNFTSGGPAADCPSFGKVSLEDPVDCQGPGPFKRPKMETLLAVLMLFEMVISWYFKVWICWPKVICFGLFLGCILQDFEWKSKEFIRKFCHTKLWSELTTLGIHLKEYDETKQLQTQAVPNSLMAAVYRKTDQTNQVRQWLLDTWDL